MIACGTRARYMQGMSDSAAQDWGGARDGAGCPKGQRRVAQYGDVVRVRLAPELRKRIANKLEFLDKTESEFIREAIENALSRDGA